MGTKQSKSAANKPIDALTQKEEPQIVSLAPPSMPVEADDSKEDENKSVIGRHYANWTAFLIEGYIRQHAADLVVSEEIVTFLRSWCSFEERIDEENSDVDPKKIKVKDSKQPDELQIIECVEDDVHIWHLFGTNLHTKGQKICWRFRILQHWGCTIGIVNAEHIRQIEHGSFAENKDIDGYGLNTLDGKTYHHAGIPWKKLWDDDIEDNAVIEMELDLTEREHKFGTLRYKLNGVESNKLAFKGIVSNREYKLAIGIRCAQSLALLKNQTSP